MVETKIQMRFGDIDMFNHVNNVALQHYYDIGTHDYIINLFGKKNFINENTLVKAHISVNYLIPTHMNEEVMVRTNVTKIGNRSITLFQTIVSCKTEEIKSDCTTILVGFNALTGVSAEILPEYKNAIAKHEDITE